ncbi:MAG: TonB-dependent receptor plug domain-containing protein [Chitinophagaceae bacterium]|nr:TonB-dependent receptor plug domain-containing protein [Chitinophagaceae bacterium]
MLTALYYFLQVILCSGIMMGYYWLVLRDKKFHQYNRFYLLLTAATAWIIPLIKIQWVPKPAAKVPVYEFLTVIADSNTRIDASLYNRWYQLSWQSGLTLLYVVVSTVFLIILLTGIMRVWKLVRTHTITSVGDFFLILTKTAGTPFSFFSYVFWNEAVDINSTTGKQMLQHEITHVQQKHSFDKLFIQLVMIAGWFNPFFWMIKAEMSMIHEYIADKKSVEQGDTAALAAMLLTAAYPQQQFLLSNPFFFSPIKRRIAMLTNQSHPKFSYLRRLVILPLLAVVVVLFAFRSNELREKQPLSLVGAVTNITTPVINKIKSVVVPVKTDIVKKDTTILTGDSVYVIPNGKEVKIIGNPTFVTPKDGNIFYFSPKSSQTINLKGFPNDVLIILDGKIIDKKILDSYDSNAIESVTVLKDKASIAVYGEEGKNGVIIIKSRRPKVVQGYKIEEESTGREKILVNSFESTNNNVKDFNKALYLLDGLIVDSTSFKMISPSDIHSINILNSKQGEELFGEKGKFGVIDIKTKQYLLSKSSPLSVTSIRKGFDISEIAKEFYTRNPDIKNVYWSHSPLKMHIHLHNGSVESYDLTNASSKALAEKRYGALPIPNKKLVEISLKKAEGDTTFPKKMPLSIRTVPKGKLGEEKGYEKVFTISQVPASFPGGKSAWDKYLERNLKKDIVVEKGGPPGTYTVIVSFIVNSEGFISEVKAVNDPGYGSAAEAVRLIQKGPRWKPAQQNGKNVTSRVKQSITYVVSEE